MEDGDGGAGGPLQARIGQMRRINRLVEEESWSVSAPVAVGERHASLAILALVQLATDGTLYEQEEQRRELLVRSLCQSLASMGVISDTLLLEDLAGLRATYTEPFYRLVALAREALPAPTLPALPAPDHQLVASALRTSVAFAFRSRYAEEFVEGELLGAGGFGSVHRATNRLDKVAYAVKKVRMVLSSRALLLKILREATVLAKLSHPNIVAYKTAWTEPCAAARATPEEEESSSASRSIEDWEDGGAVIEEVVGSPPDWSSGLKRVVGRPMVRPGRFWGGESWSESQKSAPWESQGAWDSSVAFQEASGREVARREAGRREVAVLGPGGDWPAAHACTLYIQMELCSSTLRQWLDERNAAAGAVAADGSFAVFRQLLLAAEYLHAQGVIHRDIKPRNVFINSRLEVKLGDFGLAKELVVAGSPPDTPLEVVQAATFPPAGARRDTSGVGTSAYAAPEQLRAGGRVGPASDLYSLGVVLWELYTKTATDMERVAGISAVREGVPGAGAAAESAQAGLGALLARLTSACMEERPSATAVLQEHFSEKDLVLLEGGREQRALRQQVELQARQLAAQGSLITEQEQELAVLRALLARLRPAEVPAVRL